MSLHNHETLSIHEYHSVTYVLKLAYIGLDNYHKSASPGLAQTKLGLVSVYSERHNELVQKGLYSNVAVLQTLHFRAFSDIL